MAFSVTNLKIDTQEGMSWDEEDMTQRLCDPKNISWWKVKY